MHEYALAAAQTIAVRGDVAANIAQHLELVRCAAAQRARLLVFPELSLTGYELDLADSLAFTEHDARLAPLAEAARTHAMQLVVGAPLRIDSALYIGAVILGPDGSTTLYTKHHLGAFQPSDALDGVVPPPEESVFRAGTCNPLLELAGHRIAVSICADSLYRSHLQSAAERGADTYLSSQFATPRYYDLKVSVLQRRAVRFGLTVVLANFTGSTGGLPAAGGSGIWSREGEVLAQLGSQGIGVALAAACDSGFRTRTVML